MMPALGPWTFYGGSFIWAESGGKASVAEACCPRMRPAVTGSCKEGCCDDYQCASCGREWRYEYPD